MMNQNKKVVLCLNIGTPKDPSVSSVKAYLREFLSDPRVLNIPYIARKLLLNFVILPFRSPKSAEAYRSIWREDGSPLLLETKSFCHKLQEKLGSDYSVLPAMRYGEPSLKSALLLVEGAEEIILFPQYPHYASSSTGSSLELAFKVLANRPVVPSIRVIKPFYKNDGFIEALYQRVIEVAGPREESRWDHLLMSYHGLPEDQVVMTESSLEKSCHRDKPCSLDFKTTFCYRKQCYETSYLLAQKLNLESSSYTVSFQSRLGSRPWIKPYTDHVLEKLYKDGVRKLAVTCPSFVADCLETLEEIAIRLKSDWMSLGGESFIFIPCVNDSSVWIEASYHLIKG